MDTTTHTASLTFRIGSALSLPFTAFWSALVRMAEANSIGHARLSQADRLQARSDAQLAELGLPRRRIPQRTFGDLY